MTENPPAVGDTWYRLDDQHYASINEWGDVIPGGGYQEIILTKYKVTRTTPKGVWIAPADWVQPRFVLLEANKRYACSTLDAAKESFVARKRKQARIHQRRADDARAAIDMVIGPFAKNFE
jgi:hypothetical protein